MPTPGRARKGGRQDCIQHRVCRWQPVAYWSFKTSGLGWQPDRSMHYFFPFLRCRLWSKIATPLETFSDGHVQSKCPWSSWQWPYPLGVSLSKLISQSNQISHEKTCKRNSAVGVITASNNSKTNFRDTCWSSNVPINLQGIAGFNFFWLSIGSVPHWYKRVSTWRAPEELNRHTLISGNFKTTHMGSRPTEGYAFASGAKHHILKSN